MSNQKTESTQPAAKRARLEQREIKCVDDLYLEAKFADVLFSFNSDDGTTIRIPAHKLLLAVVSDVFEAMFYGGLKETGDIVITDASAGEFKEFLQFFYGKDVELTTEHVAGVMNLGHKYNVEKCVDACVQYLKKNLTYENVCAALSLAALYDQNDLMVICNKCIHLNTDAVFESAAFLKCSNEVLAHILQMNPLLCSEADVFEACMAWVRAKSQQNTVSKAAIEEYLGDLYYEIRFASMTIQEFCMLEEKYSDVFKDDFHTITRLIAKTNKNPGRFNTSLRQVGIPKEIKWNKNKIIRCDRDSISPIGRHKLDTEEKMIFSTNQPLLLYNFRCNGIYFGNDNHKNLESDLPIEVQIAEARTLNNLHGTVLSNMKTKLNKDDTTTVSLPQPILIRPNYFYTISVKGFAENHYFESNEQMSSVTLESGIKIEFHNDKIVEGKISGLIYQLNFNEIEK